MARNFDEELNQDLAFTIGGEQFEMRYVRPEVLAIWEEEPDIEKSSEVLKKQDERIAHFLASDADRERWYRLREREDNALSLVHVNELLRWMVEVQTARPTNPPSPSVVGRGKTAPSSKAA